ncbi:hypothetical protein CK219_28560 [Mesorhizobium sp. WSM4313]|nr:hypothetical protein CK219_28560 [Mesorhizobium sp. WSM4313]
MDAESQEILVSYGAFGALSEIIVGFADAHKESELEPRCLSVRCRISRLTSQMRIKDSELEPVCKTRLRTAGLADEDLGTLNPRSFSDHCVLTRRAMEGEIGIEQFTCKRHHFVSALTGEAKLMPGMRPSLIRAAFASDKSPD